MISALNLNNDIDLPGIDNVEKKNEKTTKKILIAENEMPIQRLLGKTIKRLFSEIVPKEECFLFIAKDGKEAIEIARRELPHLVLLDIMLPKLMVLTFVNL